MPRGPITTFRLDPWAQAHRGVRSTSRGGRLHWSVVLLTVVACVAALTLGLVIYLFLRDQTVRNLTNTTRGSFDAVKAATVAAVALASVEKTQPSVNARSGGSSDSEASPDTDNAASGSGSDSDELRGPPTDRLYLDLNKYVRLPSQRQVNRLGLTTFEIVFEVDGVRIEDGERVLLRSQEDPRQNGIYVKQGAQLTRASDLSQASHFTSGVSVFVEQGKTHGNAFLMLQAIKTSEVAPDDISGYGAYFVSLNEVQLGGTEAKEGYVAVYDPNQPSKISWKAASEATGQVFSSKDDTFRIENAQDSTKKLAFDASGLATGSVRYVRMPDEDVSLQSVGTSDAPDFNGLQVASETVLSHDGAGDVKLNNITNLDATTISTFATLVGAGVTSHNDLTDVNPNEHKDHSQISVLGGTGLDGGGTIDDNVTLNLNVNSLSAPAGAVAATDALAAHSTADGATRKLTVAQILGLVDHDALTNFETKEHIDHSQVSVLAGTGLSGGGTIDGNVTVNMDVDSLSAPAGAVATTDTLAAHSTADAATRKLTVAQIIGLVDHDALTNFETKEHIDHSQVSVLAGTGLSGGGTIDANVTVNMDVDSLSAPAGAVATTDTLAAHSTADAATRKLTVAQVIGLVDHDALTNYDGKEHVDHSQVSVLAGTGLSGGGTIDANVTVNMDVNSLSAPAGAVATTDELAAHSTADAATRKLTVAQIIGLVDHDALTNFETKEHVDHTQVSVLAGTGLSGGGTIDANVTVNMDVDSLSAPAGAVATTDTLAAHSTADAATRKLTVAQIIGLVDHDALTNFETKEHVDHTQVSVLAGTGLSGGGTIDANVTVNMDVDSLSAPAGAVATTDTLAAHSTADAATRKLTVAQIIGLVDHDALTNFETKEHVDHTQVSVLAGTGLSGGGTIDANVTVNMDVDSLSAPAGAVATTDTLAAHSTADAATRKLTVAQVIGLVDHDALTNFETKEHVDHTQVSVLAGDGLSGGGTIDANVTVNLDVNSLSAPAGAVATTDTLAAHSTADAATRKLTIAQVANLADHNALTNYEGKEHVDHSQVSVLAGTGLSGGGTIDANVTVNMDVNSLSAPAGAVATTDTLAAHSTADAATRKLTVAQVIGLVDHDALTNYEAKEHVDHSQVSVLAGTGLSGGGTIENNVTVNLDVNSLATAAGVQETDSLAAHSTVDGATRKLTVSDVLGLVDHDTLTNYEAKEHVDHSQVSVLAGTGLSGGGTIDANVTVNMDVNSLSAPAGAVATTDTLAAHSTADAATRKLTVAQVIGLVDHDALTNFETKEHVDHSQVSVLAGTGLSGGGTIDANVTVNMDVNSLSAPAGAVATTDTLAAHSTADAATRKLTVAQIIGLVDHDALTNFEAKEHIDHTQVSVLAGTGLSGGGTIDANVTVNMDVNSLSAPAGAVATTDELAAHNQADGATRKLTVAQIIGLVDHDALTNFETKEHVDHSQVSVLAGTGLSGGGTIDGNVTVNMDVNSLSAPAGAVATTDELAAHNQADAATRKLTVAQLLGLAEVATSATSGLAGGGTLDATRNLAVDVTQATAETTADNADLVLIHSDAAGALRKMTRANFLAGVGGGESAFQTDYAVMNDTSEATSLGTGLVLWRTPETTHVGTNGASSITVASQQGRPTWSFTANSSYVATTNALPIDTDYEATLAVVFGNGPTVSGLILSLDQSGVGTTDSAYRLYYNAGTPGLEIKHSGSTTAFGTLNGSTLAGATLVLRLVRNRGGSAELYVNGAWVATAEQLGLYTGGETFDTFYLGANAGETTSGSTGMGVQALAVWNRALTEAQSRSLNDTMLAGDHAKVLTTLEYSGSPLYWIVAGETTNRCDLAALTFFGSLAATLDADNGKYKWVLSDASKWIQINAVPLSTTTRDFTMYWAIGNPGANGAGYFMQTWTGNRGSRTNHFVQSLPDTGGINFDQWGGSGTRPTFVAAGAGAYDGAVLCFRHTSDNSGRASYFFNGTLIDTQLSNEVYTGPDVPNVAQIGNRYTNNASGHATGLELYAFALYNETHTDTQVAAVTWDRLTRSRNVDQRLQMSNPPLEGPLWRVGGREASDLSAPISTLNSSSNGIARSLKVNVNGTDYWIPASSQPLGAASQYQYQVVERWTPKQGTTNWSGNVAYDDNHLYNSPQSNGTYAQYDYTGATAGNFYRFHIDISRGTNRGILDITVDGATDQTGFDADTASISNYNSVYSTSAYQATSDTISVRLTLNGSTNGAYYIVVAGLYVEELVPLDGLGTPASLIAARTDPEVYLDAYRDAGAYTTTTATVVFNKTRHNRNGDYDPATGIFTCTSPGFYTATTDFMIVANSGQSVIVRILHNAEAVASGYTNSTSWISGSRTAEVFLKENDTLKVDIVTGGGQWHGTTDASATTSYNRFIIKQASRPPVVEAQTTPSCLVVARMTSGAGSNVDGILNFNSISKGGADFNGTVFTAPSDGEYEFRVKVIYGSASAVSTLHLRKNGVNTEFVSYLHNTNESWKHAVLDGVITMYKGETADIYFDYTSANLYTVDYNSLIIKRIGEPPTVNSLALSGAEAGIPMMTPVAHYQARNGYSDGWTSNNNVTVDSNDRIYVSAPAAGDYLEYSYTNAVVGRAYSFLVTLECASNRAVAYLSFAGNSESIAYDCYVSTTNQRRDCHSRPHVATSSTVRCRITCATGPVNGSVQLVQYAITVFEHTPYTNVSSGLVTELPTPLVLVQGYLATIMSSSDLVKWTATTNLGNWYNPTTGLITAQTTGWFEFNATLVNDTAGGIDLILRKNSGGTTGTGRQADGEALTTGYLTASLDSSTIIWLGMLQKGDTLDVYFNNYGAGRLNPYIDASTGRDKGFINMNFKQVGYPNLTTPTLPASAVAAYRNAGDISTAQDVKWNVKTVDIGGDYDTTTGEYTAPHTGTFFVHAYARNSTGLGRLMLIKNGTVIPEISAASNGNMIPVTTLLNLDSGDVIKVYWENYGSATFHNSGDTMYGSTVPAADCGLVVFPIGLPPSVVVPAAKIAFFRTQRASTVANGTCNQNTWQTRPLTSLVDHHAVGFGLTNNEMSFPPGDYWVHVRAPFFKTNGSSTRLVEVANGSVVAVIAWSDNPQSHSSDNTTTFSEFQCYVSVTTTTTYRLEANCNTTRATDGLGNLNNLASTTITYEQVTVLQLSAPQTDDSQTTVIVDPTQIVVMPHGKAAKLWKTSTGDNGGTTAGAWYTRPLSNYEDSSGMGLTFDPVTSRWTLLAGTYMMWAHGPLHNCSRGQNRVQDMTNGSPGTTLEYGTTVYLIDSNYGNSVVYKMFTITEPHTYEFQYRVTGAQASSGLGVNGEMNSNMFEQIMILQLAPGATAQTAVLDATENISALSEVTELADNDYFRFYDTSVGATRKIAASNLLQEWKSVGSYTLSGGTGSNIYVDIKHGVSGITMDSTYTVYRLCIAMKGANTASNTHLYGRWFNSGTEVTAGGYLTTSRARGLFYAQNHTEARYSANQNYMGGTHWSTMEVWLWGGGVSSTSAMVTFKGFLRDNTSANPFDIEGMFNRTDTNLVDGLRFWAALGFSDFRVNVYGSNTFPSMY